MQVWLTYTKLHWMLPILIGVSSFSIAYTIGQNTNVTNQQNTINKLLKTNTAVIQSAKSMSFNENLLSQANADETFVTYGQENDGTKTSINWPGGLHEACSSDGNHGIKWSWTDECNGKSNCKYGILIQHFASDGSQIKDYAGSVDKPPVLAPVDAKTNIYYESQVVILNGSSNGDVSYPRVCAYIAPIVLKVATPTLSPTPSGNQNCHPDPSCVSTKTLQLCNLICK